MSPNYYTPDKDISLDTHLYLACFEIVQGLTTEKIKLHSFKMSDPYFSNICNSALHQLL